MLSTPREKNLAMIFGSCMVLLLLWETVGQIILQPLNDAQTSETTTKMEAPPRGLQ